MKSRAGKYPKNTKVHFIQIKTPFSNLIFHTSQICTRFLHHLYLFYYSNISFCQKIEHPFEPMVHMSFASLAALQVQTFIVSFQATKAGMKLLSVKSY